MTQFKNLDEMLQSSEYQDYASDTIYNLQYHILSGKDESEIDEIIEANDNGSFGIDHFETIENWNNFLDTVDIPENILNSILDEIQDTYNYHCKNNTIHEMT